MQGDVEILMRSAAVLCGAKLVDKLEFRAIKLAETGSFLDAVCLEFMVLCSKLGLPHEVQHLCSVYKFF